MNDVQEARYEPTGLPYRIAVICYLWSDGGDEEDSLLMLHRAKEPNTNMYSPIGGKVEVSIGESPHQCAMREIREEAGLELDDDDVRLFGVVAEKAYQGDMHWLLFLFEAMSPVDPQRVTRLEFDEGVLEWVKANEVEKRNIPRTDRDILWPLVQRHRGGGFFMIDVDCSGEELDWRMVQERPV
jgi:8-oxo-dGTP diphosphatase